MTQAVLYRPVTSVLRDWLRAHATFDTTPTNQIYAGGLPTGISGESVALFRVGGLTDGPVERPLIQFDVRATTGSAAEALVTELLSLLESTAPGTELAANVIYMGAASVTAPIWSPDQPGDTPRYVLTVEMAVKSLP